MEKEFLKDCLRYFKGEIFKTTEEKNDSEKELEKIFDKVLKSEISNEQEKIIEGFDFNLENFIEDIEKQIIEISKETDIEKGKTENINELNKNSEEIKEFEKEDSLGDFFRKFDMEEVILGLQFRETQNLERELENLQIIDDEGQEKIDYASPYTLQTTTNIQELSENYWDIPDYMSSIKGYEIKKNSLDEKYGEMITYLKEEQVNSFQRLISSMSELMIESIYEPRMESMTESMTESMMYAITRISSFEKTRYKDECWDE